MFVKGAPGCNIFVKFYICYNNIAVMPCAKICGEQFMIIWMSLKWIFPQMYLWEKISEIGLWIWMPLKWDVIMIDQHQAMTWTGVDFSLMGSCGIHLRAISQWLTKPQFCLMSLKIISLKLLPHLPGANELSVICLCNFVFIDKSSQFVLYNKTPPTTSLIHILL